MKCYISKDELTSENSSKEHIIHQFLGGKIKSKEIMTAKWNDIFASTIDLELSKQIILGQVMDVKRERKNNRKIQAQDESGNKYLIDPGGVTAEKKPSKPREFIDDSGEKVIEVRGSEAIKQYLKSYKKKNPGVSEEEIKKRSQDFTNPTEKNIIPEGHGLQPLSGVGVYRAIAKIAANFYVFKTKDIIHIQPIVDFIKKGIYSKEVVFPFYKFTREQLEIKKDETCHLLKLVGNQSERLLYCYLELFNVHNFIVVLNGNYQGQDIDFNYQHNLQTGEQNEKLINIGLDENEIRNLVFPGTYRDKGYEERMLAFGKANEVEFFTNPNEKE